MEITSGRPDVTIGLIDGPVAVSNPDLVRENIRFPRSIRRQPVDGAVARHHLIGLSPDIFEREHQSLAIERCTVAPEKAVCFGLSFGRASFSRFGPTSIGVWTFDAILQQLAGLGVDTDFVCHATILDIEGVA